MLNKDGSLAAKSMREWVEELADDLGYDLEGEKFAGVEAQMIAFALHLWASGDRMNAESHARAAFRAHFEGKDGDET